MDLEAYELVLLLRPPDATDFDDETLDRIQREHLAYLRSLREQGLVATNGPLLDQPDPAWRGLTFFRTGSPVEARRLAEADPAVKAGRLAVEMMTWWCPAGSLRQPGKPVTVQD